MSNKVLLDLKGRELSVYSFENGNGHPKGAITIPVGEDYSFAFEGPIGAEEFIFSLPLSLLDFRVLEMPFSDIKKVRELLPFEIDNLVLGGSSSVMFDAVILGRSEGKSQVLVAYIVKETLRKILNKLKSAGIDPKAVISLELAHAVSSSAAPGELSRKLFSPDPLEEKERIAAALGEMRSQTVNLRRGEFAYTVDTERTKKSLMLTALLLILLLLIFLADSAMVIVSTKRENDSLRESKRKTYMALFPSEKKISNELYQLKAHIKELKDKESVFIGVSPLKVLLDLSSVGGPGISFSEVTVDRDINIFKGEAPSMSDVQKVKTEMERVFTDVVISDTKPSSQGKTLFTITARGNKK